MLKFLLLPVTCLVLGCVSETNKPDDSKSKAQFENELGQLNQKIDSLNKVIDTLQTSFSKDTSYIQEEVKIEKQTSDTTSLTIPKIEKEKTPQQKPKPTITIKEEVPQKTTSQNDTIFHYYINGSVSVKIFPWENGERTIQLFNLYGKKTFETNDVKQSYSVFNHLSFHSNGGVSKIVESTNPGASMYMYEATMKFSSTNDPEIRTESKTPSSLEEMMKDKIPFFWNKNEKKWIKQEVVIEAEVPEEFRK